MRSHVTAAFRQQMRRLPESVYKHALRSYRAWLASPDHPSLAFKHVGRQTDTWSVRIGIGWRALGVRRNDTIIWFWIGSHAEYDGLLKRL